MYHLFTYIWRKPFDMLTLLTEVLNKLLVQQKHVFNLYKNV